MGNSHDIQYMGDDVGFLDINFGPLLHFSGTSNILSQDYSHSSSETPLYCSLTSFGQVFEIQSGKSLVNASFRDGKRPTRLLPVSNFSPEKSYSEVRVCLC